MKRVLLIILLLIFCAGCALTAPEPEPYVSDKEVTVHVEDKESLFSLTKRETEIFQMLPDTMNDKWQIPEKSKKGQNNGIYDELVSNTIPLSTGDVVLRLTSSMNSFAIAITSLSGYSHCGLVLEEDKDIFVVDIHPKDDENVNSIGKSSLQEWVGDNDERNILHVLVLRTKETIDTNVVREKMYDFLSRDIKFDYDFKFSNNINDKNLYYCSEYIYEIMDDLFESDWNIMNSETIVKTVGKQVISTINRYATRTNKEHDEFRDLLIKYGGDFEPSAEKRHKLITPAGFAFSTRFHRIAYAPSKYIHDYPNMLSLYKRTEKKYLALLSLHARSKSLSTSVIKQKFAIYGLSAQDINDIMFLVQANENEYFNADELIFKLMHAYAASDKTYKFIFNSLNDI